MSAARLAAAVLLVAGTAVVATSASATTGGRATFDIPYAIAPWKGADAGALDAATVRALGADLILNRAYVAPGEGPVGFYLAYYARQQPGVSIHSPLHCLPGTGWDVLSDGSLRVALAGGTSGPVRRLIARKTNSRVLILYWYAIHGKMIASDVGSRWQLVGDRLRLGRNDGALVRLVVPVTASDAAAERRGVAFIRALVPYLEKRAD